MAPTTYGLFVVTDRDLGGKGYKGKATVYFLDPTLTNVYTHMHTQTHMHTSTRMHTPTRTIEGKCLLYWDPNLPVSRRMFSIGPRQSTLLSSGMPALKHLSN